MHALNLTNGHRHRGRGRGGEGMSGGELRGKWGNKDTYAIP